LDEITRASRPLILAPPALCTADGKKLLRDLQNASGVPVSPMESPRGILDPSLGAFAAVLAEADLIVLLGKQLDYTLRFGRPPAVNSQCRWIVIDPDAVLIERAENAQKDRVTC